MLRPVNPLAHPLPGCVCFPMKTSSLTILLSVLALCAQAELSLNVPVVEVKPKPEDEETQVVFKFRNKGDKAVKILGLESACSCLSAELDKAEYKPGEEGSGTAVFKVASFSGRHEKHITVNTDDPKQSAWQVNFVLNIASVIEVKPKTLEWFIGDEAKSKSCLIEFTGEEPMKIIKIDSTRETVTFEWKELEEGRKYLVTATPKNTQEVTLGALKIETSSSIPKFRHALAFFSISRKPDVKVTKSE